MQESVCQEIQYFKDKTLNFLRLLRLYVSLGLINSIKNQQAYIVQPYSKWNGINKIHLKIQILKIYLSRSETHQITAIPVTLENLQPPGTQMILRGATLKKGMSLKALLQRYEMDAIKKKILQHLIINPHVSQRKPRQENRNEINNIETNE